MPDLAGSYFRGLQTGYGLTSDLVSGGVEAYQKAKSYKDAVRAKALEGDRASAEKAEEVKEQKEQLAYERNKDAGLSVEELETFKKDKLLPSRMGANAQVTGMEGQERIDSAVNKALADRMKGHFVVAQDDLKNPNLKNYKVGELAPERLKNPEKTEADKGREEKRLDDRVTTMGKDLDPSAFRAGAFGVSKQVFDRSERLESLLGAVDSMQKGDADSRQIEELAIGMNSMLSGSNSGAQETIKGLVPKTVYGDSRKLQEWLTNNPTGTGQKEFVKRMRGTIEREAQTAQDQIKRTRYQRLAKWDDVRTKDPERWDSVARSFDVDPGEYDKWVKGGRKPMGAGGDKGDKSDPYAAYKDPTQAKKILDDYKAGPQTRERYDEAHKLLKGLAK